ncbi:hypothetical protein [Natrinema soli]|uniref:Uncharacterized protein n=1 Tax=Natrinema soli TaxID=1930624 RepID=A0ABD5SXN5_9EURY|nr:hypothetical protein [Natrinema soli]
MKTCAFLGEERRNGGFYGFWTNDSPTVDGLVPSLETTYDVS